MKSSAWKAWVTGGLSVAACLQFGALFVVVGRSLASEEENRRATTEEESRAQPRDHELQGTLKKVRDTGVLLVGYRESSVPFSYLNARREPIGYAIDLGHAVAAAVSNELGGTTVTVKFVPVTSETRLEAVRSGRVDLECGSTTANAERAKQVAFSPVFFVAGTKLLVKRGSPVASFRDLGGRTVVVTAGTTNEEAMRRLAERFNLNLRLTTARDHAESFAQVRGGQADAFAGDDALLAGLVAQNQAGNELTVVGDFLSYDPYGLMYRRDDPQFAAVVRRAFADLAASRELEYTYNRWFLRRLPTGETLNLPMSAQLQEVFRTLGAPD